MILAVVPVYIAEVSPPKQRGVIVGLQGMMISFGFFVANCMFLDTVLSSGYDSLLRIDLLIYHP